MKMTVSCLLFVVLHILGTSEGSIQFTAQLYQGRTVTGVVGSSVNFTWSFSGGVKTVQWGLMKITAAGNDIDPIIASIAKAGSVPIISPAYTGRVNVSGDSSSALVIFTLSNIRQNDERLYGCRISPDGVSSTKTDTVNLVVTEAPSITHPTTANADYNEGSHVNISCETTGRPDADVRWIHNEQIKSSGYKTAYLTFSTISKTDAGMYTCRANNSAGSTEKQLNVVVNYPATILSITSSVSKAWIGQTVTLNCQSDGVPIPTMSWYLPNGTKFNPITAKENRVDVTMNSDGDFGFFNCTADNGFVPASRTVRVQQIKAPSSPMITSTDADIQATSLTVKWNTSDKDGGSPITAYRVLILQGATEIKNDNVTDPATRSWQVGNLHKSTNYTVKVFARNYVFEGNAVEKTFQTKFEGVPAAAEIIYLPSDTKEREITIEWKEPMDNGAPITQYTVYQRTVLEDGTTQQWHKTAEVKDLSDLKVVVTLEKGKKYDFVVTATNEHGESLKEEDTIKSITVGDVPAAVVFKYEIKDGEITLKWEEPENNGANITQYSVYQRIVDDVQWTITNISKREYVVKVEKGKEYEFVVTATNKYGESSKEDSTKVQNEVQGDTSPTSQPHIGGMNTAVIAGAAAAGVLVIVAVIISVVWWKRRKTAPGDASPSETALQNNPDEIEGGYHVAAARGLQASAAVAEPDYAQVDVSQKKKNRRPVTDEYAQVDKSKKTKKKPKKQPGELDYAELDDLRPRNQPAAARAAAARPVVRPPAYEGTLYADIGVFGLPPPEPTYDNVPKKDVVYSNVESM